MIESITLGNFKSFGVVETVPLAPITVLAGPNNSGKSNLLSIGRFIANVAHARPGEAVRAEGGSNICCIGHDRRARSRSLRSGGRQTVVSTASLARSMTKTCAPRVNS